MSGIITEKPVDCRCMSNTAQLTGNYEKLHGKKWCDS